MPPTQCDSNQVIIVIFITMAFPYRPVRFRTTAGKLVHNNLSFHTTGQTDMINIAHIHPMLVHFPLALMPVALGTQLLATIKGEGLFGRSYLQTCGVMLTVIAAVGAIVAAVFGDMALDQAVASGVPLASLENHEELGQLTAVLLSVLAVAELWFYRKDNNSATINRGTWLAGLVTVSLLFATAWFGGQLVYKLGVNVEQAASLQSQTTEHP